MNENIISNCSYMEHAELGTPECTPYVSTPVMVEIKDNQLYEDGECKGVVLRIRENKKDNSITVKYKAISNNKYINGQEKTVTFYSTKED